MQLRVKPETTDEFDTNGLHLAMREERLSDTWGRRMFWAVIVLGCGLVANGFWDHLDPRVVQETVVQPLGFREDGQVVLVDKPVPFRDYVVPHEAIQAWLGRFIVDLRRLSLDSTVNEDSQRYVAAALCGPAAKNLAVPPVRDAELVVVHVQSAPVHGPSDRTWHGEWKESWYDTRMRLKGEHRFRGDFTLARQVWDWKEPDLILRQQRHPLPVCLESSLVHEVTLP